MISDGANPALERDVTGALEMNLYHFNTSFRARRIGEHWDHEPSGALFFHTAGRLVSQRSFGPFRPAFHHPNPLNWSQITVYLSTHRLRIRVCFTSVEMVGPDHPQPPPIATTRVARQTGIIARAQSSGRLMFSPLSLVDRGPCSWSGRRPVSSARSDKAKLATGCDENRSPRVRWRPGLHRGGCRSCRRR